MKCSVCNENENKYKCPTCKIVYCSLQCWNKHKGDCQKVEEIKNQEEKIEERKVYEFPTEDTVPPEKLKLLDTDEKLHNLLTNPHLRDLLKAIDSSPNPAKLMEKAMKEPIFVEFADQCLALIE